MKRLLIGLFVGIAFYTIILSVVLLFIPAKDLTGVALKGFAGIAFAYMALACVLAACIIKQEKNE